MQRNLNLIVACTERKRKDVQIDCRLNCIAQSQPEKALDAWVKCLGEIPNENRRPARTVYCGPQWVKALELEKYAGLRPGVNKASLFVCSAGYGLINGNDRIGGYGATFASGHSDSVAVSSTRWWCGINSRFKHAGRQNSTIEDLAKSEPNAIYLIVASGNYVKAMKNDIAQARKLLNKTAQIIICSAIPSSEKNGIGVKEISDLIVPVTGKLRMKDANNPKSRGVVNLLAAEYLIQNDLFWDINKAKSELAKYQETLPEDQMPNRDRSSDHSVLCFIKRRLTENPKVSKTQLLKEYRSTGRACEQRRFGKLFQMEAESGR